MNILKITNSNYEDTLKFFCESFEENRPLLRESLRDAFSFIPQKNEIISEFVLDLCTHHPFHEDVKDILSTLLTSSSPLEVLISCVVYSKRLGFTLNFDEFKIKPLESVQSPSTLPPALSSSTLSPPALSPPALSPPALSSPSALSPLSMGEVEKIKVLEYLERIRLFVLESEGIKFGEEEVFVYFYCVSIIKNFSFSVGECVRELKETAEDQVIISSIVFLTDSEDPVYLSSLLLRIISLENYTVVLKDFTFMDKPFRDFFIGVVHENYLIKRSSKVDRNSSRGIESTDTPSPFGKEEDLNSILTFVDNETVDCLLKFVSVDNLLLFLPSFKEKIETPPISPLPKESFSVSKDKEKFFLDFCLLGSPSVSHFLSYLEIYKGEFKLEEEDQRLFLEVFNRTFINRKSFKRIILEKMVLFKIINKKLI